MFPAPKFLVLICWRRVGGEVPLEQIHDCVERLVRIRTAGLENEDRAMLGGQRQEVEHALAVYRAFSLANRQLAPEFLRQLHDLRRRPQVQAVLELDDDLPCARRNRFWIHK